MSLSKLNMSARAFAKCLAVPVNRITYILNKKKSIRAREALRLSQFFGTSALFWLNLQADFDLKTAEKKSGKKIQKEVRSHPFAA